MSVGGASQVPRPSVLHSEILHRCALVAGTMLFFFVLVELPAFLNLIDYSRLEFFGVTGDPRVINVPDPELVWIRPPHAHLSGSGLGGDAERWLQIPPAERTLFRWNLHYDLHGFRNGTDLNRAETIVIGDSIVEGMTVSDDEVVTSVLQNLQGKVVANLGQTGYGPQQELVVLKRYGLPLQPRNVIWMFSEATDLGDTIRYRQTIAHGRSFWNLFLQRSFTHLAHRTLKRKRRIPGIKRSGLIETASGEKWRVYFDVDTPPNPDKFDAIPEATGIIAAANRLAAAQGVRFVFIFVPEKFRVYRPFCQFSSESECARWIASDLPDRMRQVVASLPGAGYVDLTNVFQEAVRKRSLPYYSDDVHWTPEGHAIAAEAINAYLSAQ